MHVKLFSGIYAVLNYLKIDKGEKLIKERDMEFNIADSDVENNIDFELKIELGNLTKNDYRNDLFMIIASTTIMTIGEYIQKMPTSDEFKLDKGEFLSTKDLNRCLDTFKKEHFNNFIDLLKENI